MATMDSREDKGSTQPQPEESRPGGESGNVSFTDLFADEDMVGEERRGGLTANLYKAVLPHQAEAHSREQLPPADGNGS
jgi:hypothetical protein